MKRKLSPTHYAAGIGALVCLLVLVPMLAKNFLESDYWMHRALRESIMAVDGAENICRVEVTTKSLPTPSFEITLDRPGILSAQESFALGRHILDVIEAEVRRDDNSLTGGYDLIPDMQVYIRDHTPGVPFLHLFEYTAFDEERAWYYTGELNGVKHQNERLDQIDGSALLHDAT